MNILLKLIAFVSLHAIVYILVAYPRDRLSTFHQNRNESLESYDIIVVGGGSAGSVVASRLSESLKHTVLMLEAGPTDNNPLIKIPSAFYWNYDSSIDWKYNSEPNNRHKSVYMPRGKVMGGSSSINAMIYMRGSRYDYDTWETKYDLKNWNYDTVMPWFYRSGRCLDETKDKEYHNSLGQWRYDSVKKHAVSQTVVDAFHTGKGLPLTEDFNNQEYQQEGIGYNQVNILNNTRHSVFDAFLDNDALKRRSLYIKTNVQVTRIIFEDNKAVGVEALQNGIKKFFRANKEVIISAGAYNTPQILQLSGLGDKKLLDKLEIPVILDNPNIGQNLQDHPTIMINEKMEKEETLDKYTKFPYNVIEALKYFLKMPHNLKSNVGEVNGFYVSDYSKKQGEVAPDVQIVAGPAIVQDHGRKFVEEKAGITIGSVLLKPESRGSVEIQSRNPFQHPKIFHELLKADADFIRIKEQLRTLLKIRQEKSIAEKSSGNMNFADPSNVSEKELEQYIYDNLQTLYHPCCTVAMGSVLDDQFKVKGVEGLRVVDASAMPEIPRANTNVPTVMIAEIASTFIANDHDFKLQKDKQFMNKVQDRADKKKLRELEQ